MYVSFINTCGQIHVPINLSKCCPRACTGMIILLHKADGSVSADVSNYIITHVHS